MPPRHQDDAPGRDWTPAQKERLASAIERVKGATDALGHGIDPGILQAVAMLNELDINTSASCEGHVDWATGGPYIDLVSKDYRAMKNESRAIEADASREEEKNVLRQKIRLANIVESKKILPVLNEFYKTRDTSYELRIGLSFYGEGITRLESVGVSFLLAQPDPVEKVELLKAFQAEMRDFSNFLVSYEPSAPLLHKLDRAKRGLEESVEKTPGLEDGKKGLARFWSFRGG